MVASKQHSKKSKKKSNQSDTQEFTIKQLIEKRDALLHLCSLSVPARTAFRLKKLLDRFKTELTNVDEQRMALIKKYGEPRNAEDPDSEHVVKPDMDGWDSYHEEWNALMDEKIEINFKKIGLNDLGSVGVSAQVLLALDEFLDE